MFRTALVSLIASLVAALSVPFTAAGAPPPVSGASQPAKSQNLYFAYKVKITNGLPK